MQGDFSEFCVERGAPPLPPGEMIHESPWLNLYLYPREVDYPRSMRLAPTWHNLESSVRTTDADWSVPPEIADRESSLVYVSLGSLGSGDVPLMKELVAALAETPQRYVVSKGPQHSEYELEDNMVGEEFLPQVSVLHFGKPMILMPIFWDQHDNAQRMYETGFGIRLPTYSFDRRDLWESIDRLLADSDLRDRLATVSERLQASPGNELAAELVERVAVSAEPVTSR